ncbi:hypothetical protein [Actinophytocola algeriensis]|uniref:Uncharacterized protein n=1 Tax=Actinophytocola algeriensis TaxID=1768010 RepID=A0A7W7VC86_9PSEU|nr:hypothetical protein [Actinophytocola algeriensis]MBB4904844.1 hypothetical protein [Actinophytocola algeriensis]MBE1476297.1 hypothetical protein [Actinophytocola algeriensis]
MLAGQQNAAMPGRPMCPDPRFSRAGQFPERDPQQRLGQVAVATALVGRQITTVVSALIATAAEHESADGMFAAPSTSTTRGGRPWAESTATVLDVPRSTESNGHRR